MMLNVWTALVLGSAVGQAGPNETAKAAIRSESGWVDMGTLDRDGVDGIRVRHKPSTASTASKPAWTATCPSTS